VKRIVVKHTLRMLNDLGITPLCEGTETEAEAEAEAMALADLRVNLIQGYFFAKPGFETLPVPSSYRPFRSAA
jgi:EAL domain-containing protein (putative c-di-GMP-specific phosphodiesterase class I)